MAHYIICQQEMQLLAKTIASAVKDFDENLDPIWIKRQSFYQ